MQQSKYKRLGISDDIWKNEFEETVFNLQSSEAGLIECATVCSVRGDVCPMFKFVQTSGHCSVVADDDTIDWNVEATELTEVYVKTEIIVDGGWGQWSPWSQCSHSCGEGRETRSRDCDDPRPQYGGFLCFGSKTELRTLGLLITGGFKTEVRQNVEIFNLKSNIQCQLSFNLPDERYHHTQVRSQNQ